MAVAFPDPATTQAGICLTSTSVVFEEQEAALQRLADEARPNDSGDASICVVIKRNFLTGREFIGVVGSAKSGVAEVHEGSAND